MRRSLALLAVLLLAPSMVFGQSPFKLVGAAPAPITPARPGGDYLRMPSGDIRIRSSGAAFDLKLGSDEAISADRLLKFNVGNAARTLTFSGSPTIGDWFDQSVKAAASPTFGTVTAALNGNASTASVAPAGTLTGATLAVNVLASSLTSVGTLASPVLTTPDINGGTADSLTSLSVRSTGSAFDVKIANTEEFTANRTLTLLLGADSNRSLTVSGTSSINQNVTTSGSPGFVVVTASSFVGPLTGSASGSAASLSISGQTGLLTFTGLTSTNRTWAVPDVADTVTGLVATQTLTNKTLTSPTLTTPTFSGSAVFPDNARQTFNPGADAAGLNIGAQATDPGTPSNGDLYYDSDDHLLRARINSAWVSLGAGGGTPTAITVANEATDTTSFPLFATAATGDLGPKSNAALTFNSNTGNLGSTTYNGHTFTAGSSTFTGTAGQTYTFPTTTATLARVDSTNSFAGVQTVAPNGTATKLVVSDTGAVASYVNVTNSNAPTGLRFGVQGNGASQIMTQDDFDLNLGANAINQFIVKKSGNSLVGGTSTIGTGATCNLILGGTAAAPTTTPVIGAATADLVHMAAVDFAAAKRRLYVQAEDGTATVIGGNEFYGGTASAGNLLISTTTNATKGTVTIDSDLVLSKNFKHDGARVVSTQFDATSDTVLDNITGLSVNLEAGAKYSIEGWLDVNCALMGGGKVAVSGTATMTSITYNLKAETYATSVISAFNDRKTALDSSSSIPAAATQSQQIFIRGACVCNAAGTLTVQWAQATSNGSASSVLVGSKLIVTKVQ